MSETAKIFGKSYAVFEMTHADKVTAWLLNAPTVDIYVGKYELKYRYGYDRDWGSGWVCWSEPDWEDTPESNYFNEICHALRESFYEISFIDSLLKAMKKKPFKGE
jgi:hypothetical protein